MKGAGWRGDHIHSSVLSALMQMHPLSVDPHYSLIIFLHPPHGIKRGYLAMLNMAAGGGGD